MYDDLFDDIDEFEERSTESLGQLIQEMTMAQKIKLAMHGSKEARMLLIRENERSIQVAVVKSPRITEGEVTIIAASKNVYDDVLREILANREWMKVYQVRLALVQNPKTPQASAIKLLTTLMPNDLKLIAKSKFVPGAVAQAARKLIKRKD